MPSLERTPAHSGHLVTFELARDRIAGLHATGPLPRGIRAATDRGLQPSGRGLQHRFRDALGRRLIGLGTAVAVDEGLRRGALRP
jgi:hypothetical protein